MTESEKYFYTRLIKMSSVFLEGLMEIINKHIKEIY